MRGAVALDRPVCKHMQIRAMNMWKPSPSVYWLFCFVAVAPAVRRTSARSVVQRSVNQRRCETHVAHARFLCFVRAAGDAALGSCPESVVMPPLWDGIRAAICLQEHSGQLLHCLGGTTLSVACITSLPAFCGVVGRVHVHLCGFVVCDLGIRIEFLLCSGKGLSAGEPADFSHALLNDFRFASLNGKIALEKCHFFFLLDHRFEQ